MSKITAEQYQTVLTRGFANMLSDKHLAHAPEVLPGIVAAICVIIGGLQRTTGLTLDEVFTELGMPVEHPAIQKLRGVLLETMEPEPGA